MRITILIFRSIWLLRGAVRCVRVWKISLISIIVSAQFLGRRIPAVEFPWATKGDIRLISKIILSRLRFWRVWFARAGLLVVLRLRLTPRQRDFMHGVYTLSEGKN